MHKYGQTYRYGNIYKKVLFKGMPKCNCNAPKQYFTLQFYKNESGLTLLCKASLTLSS